MQWLGITSFYNVWIQLGQRGPPVNQTTSFMRLGHATDPRPQTNI